MPGCPSYMSEDDIPPSVPLRVSPESKRLEMACRDVERAISESWRTSTLYTKSISLSNLVEAFDKLAELDSGLVKTRGKQNICFFFINESQQDLSPKLSVFLN